MAFDDDLVLGIDLGRERQIVAALVDDGGRLHGEHAVPAPWDPDRVRVLGLLDEGGHETPAGPLSTGDRVIDRLTDVARTLLGQAEASGSRVRGVGVGIPGVSAGEDGVISADRLGWTEMRLAGRLGAELDLPVWVDSDVNLAALAELHFGAGRGVRHLVWVNVGPTVGAAVILDGKLYRGQGRAGALGTLLPGTSFLDGRDPRTGALEALVSSAGIAHRARVLADSTGLPVPADGLRAEDVFTAAAEGTGWACAVLEETVDYLAVALTAIQALLDPERVILGGVAVAGTELLPALVKRLGELPHPPRLFPSELGARAVALGAAAAARHQLAGRHTVPQSMSHP